MFNVNLQKNSDDEVSVRVEGELVIGPEAHQLRETLDALIGKYPHTVVDLAGLSKIDSTGVGVLVQAYGAASDRGNCLRVVNVTGQVREVLLLVKLLTVFDGDSGETGLAA